MFGKRKKQKQMIERIEWYANAAAAANETAVKTPA